MQKSQVFSLIGAAVALTAFVVGRAVGQVNFGEAVPIAIGNFPSAVGEWKAVQTVPQYDDLNEVLPTAQVNERVYANPSGDSMDLMLLTAKRYGEIHSPANCFGYQGWKEMNNHDVLIGGQKVGNMLAMMDGRQEEVIYWVPDFYRLPPPSTAAGRALLAFYRKHGGSNLGDSLLVRIITPATPQSHKDIIQLTRDILDPLKKLPYQSQS